MFASRVHHRSHDSKMHSINSLLQIHNNSLQNSHHRPHIGQSSPSTSIESCPESRSSHQSSDSEHSLYSSSPRTNQLHKSHNHHHHSIQVVKRYFRAIYLRNQEIWFVYGGVQVITIRVHVFRNSPLVFWSINICRIILSLQFPLKGIHINKSIFQ